MTKQTGGRGGGKGGGRKPPKEHQWAKGKSGNPKGRPPKAAAEPLQGELAQIILAEGFKPITVTECGKPVSMQAVQAVLTAMLLAAVKGNSHAGRSYIQFVANAQAQQQKQKVADIAAAMGLQMDLECARMEFVARGGDEMQIAWHPSDIEIDHTTGEVKSFLAMTAEDRRARTRRVEYRDYLLGRIARSLATAAEDGDDLLLQMNRDLARSSVVMINEGLPSRFRRVPPEDKPALGPESTPEELWRATLQPTIDFFTARVGGDRGEHKDCARPSSASECEASGEGPCGDTTGDDDGPVSPQDDEAE